MSGSEINGFYFWERATHSADRMFSLLCLFVALIVSHFGFEGRTLVLIA